MFFLSAPDNFLVQRFQNLHSEDLGSYDLSMNDFCMKDKRACEDDFIHL